MATENGGRGGGRSGRLRAAVAAAPAASGLRRRRGRASGLRRRRGLAFDRGWGPASDGTGGPSPDQMIEKFEPAPRRTPTRLAKTKSAGRRDSENIFGRKIRSVSQMIDLVVAMNSVQVSSKSELSSTTFGHFKVYAILRKIPIAASALRKVLKTSII